MDRQRAVGRPTARSGGADVSCRFPKGLRLRERREYLAAQRTGRKIHGSHFMVIVARRSPGSSHIGGRVGITVSKKVGNAVTRNRLKRLVREFTRTHADWLPAGYDVVVIAKRSAAELAGLADVAADLARVRSRCSAC